MRFDDSQPLFISFYFRVGRWISFFHPLHFKSLEFFQEFSSQNTACNFFSLNFQLRFLVYIVNLTTSHSNIALISLKNENGCSFDAKKRPRSSKRKVNEISRKLCIKQIISSQNLSSRKRSSKIKKNIEKCATLLLFTTPRFNNTLQFQIARIQLSSKISFFKVI